MQNSQKWLQAKSRGISSRGFTLSKWYLHWFLDNRLFTLKAIEFEGIARTYIPPRQLKEEEWICAGITIDSLAGSAGELWNRDSEVAWKMCYMDPLNLIRQRMYSPSENFEHFLRGLQKNFDRQNSLKCFAEDLTTQGPIRNFPTMVRTQ